VILDEILANKRREVDERRAKRPLLYPADGTGSRPYTVDPIGPGSSDPAGRGSVKPAEASGSAEVTTFAGPETAAPAALAHATTGRASPATSSGPHQVGREAAAASARPPGTGAAFVAALRQPGVSFIAEIKRSSPSGGEIRPSLSVAEIATTYADAGAAALSVLTDARYFGGADADLTTAQHATDLPALRKDFVVDPYQILEARLLGASAVLLIVRALEDAELRELLKLTDHCGMAALVETHSAAEVERALGAGARVIGVNNRDLDTLVTDVSLAPRLRSLVPAECVFVAESGISRPEDVALLVDAGIDAVLVGEALLRAADPGAKLRELIAAGAPERVLEGTP